MSKIKKIYHEIDFAPGKIFLLLNIVQRKYDALKALKKRLDKIMPSRPWRNDSDWKIFILLLLQRK